jgi:UTP-glucose-1-phosphate uridylyltransferase
MPVYAVVVDNATYYDTGNKLDYLETVVEHALKHEDLGEGFIEYLKTLKL